MIVIFLEFFAWGLLTAPTLVVSDVLKLFLVAWEMGQFLQKHQITELNEKWVSLSCSVVQVQSFLVYFIFIWGQKFKINLSSVAA